MTFGRSGQLGVEERPEVVANPKRRKFTAQYLRMMKRQLHAAARWAGCFAAGAVPLLTEASMARRDMA